MTRHSRRDWRVDPMMGTLVLSIEVDVNGKTFRQNMAIDRDAARFGGPPPEYIERKMRHQIMRAVEDELLGPLA